MGGTRALLGLTKRDIVRIIKSINQRTYNEYVESRLLQLLECIGVIYLFISTCAKVAFDESEPMLAMTNLRMLSESMWSVAIGQSHCELVLTDVLSCRPEALHEDLGRISAPAHAQNPPLQPALLPQSGSLAPPDCA